MTELVRKAQESRSRTQDIANRAASLSAREGILIRNRHSDRGKIQRC